MIALVLAAAAATQAPSHADGRLPNPLATVYFATGSTELGADDRRALRAAVDWLADHPGHVLVLEGHADAHGDRTANLELAQDRTDRVRDTLVRFGADPGRIASSAFGEAEATDEPERDRRVAVIGTIRPFEQVTPPAPPARVPR